MSNIIKGLFLVCFSAILSVSSMAGDGDKKAKTFTGKVVDAHSSEGLPGAEVIIEGTSIKVFTDFDGNFTIKNIPAGSYNIKASYVAYGEVQLRNIKVGEEIPNAVQIKLHQN